MILNWFINFYSGFIRGFFRGLKTLFSIYFYRNIISSFKDICKLIKVGNFLIVTDFKVESSGAKVNIYSRFQADGDILNVLSEKGISQSDFEKICKLHSKNVKQKLESIWFFPKFAFSATGAILAILLYWTNILEHLYNLVF